MLSCGGESRRGHRDRIQTGHAPLTQTCAIPVATGQAANHKVYSPAQGHEEARWGASLFSLFPSVFNVIQKMNLPYSVLGPVCPGCIQMWAAILQRWILTSSGQGKVRSARCQTRCYFRSTSFQRASFEDEAGAFVTELEQKEEMALEDRSVGHLAHTLSTSTQANLTSWQMACWEFLDFLIYDSCFMLFMCIINYFVHSTLMKWTWPRGELFSKIQPSFSK